MCYCARRPQGTGEISLNYSILQIQMYFLYYYEVIFQRPCEVFYLMRDECLPSDSLAGSALQIFFDIFDQFQGLKR